MEKQTKATPKATTHPRKGVRKLFYFALVIGFVLIGTPFAIQYGIIEGLIAAGSKQVKVEDVDFNPFTGVLAVKNLEARTESEPELKVALLSIEVDWLPLFRQQIMVKSILLKGAHLEVEQGKGKEKALTVAGLKIPSVEAEKKAEKESAPSAWGIGLGRVHFVDNDINFKSPDFSTDIKIEDLSLAQLFSWKPGQAADVAFNTEINSAAVSGDLEIVAFSEVPTFKGKLKIDQFVLDHFITLAGGTLKELKGKLSTDISFSLSVEESGILYQQEGSISLQDSEIGLEDIQLVHQKIAWNGDVNFVLTDGEAEVVAKGNLVLDKHLNSLNSPELDTQMESANWNGEVHFKVVGEQSDLNVAGDFIATGLNSRNRRTKLTALQLDKLTVKGVLIDQLEDIQLSKIVLDGLTVAQKQAKRKPLINLAQVRLEKLQLKMLKDIDVESVEIDSLVADINVNKNGNVALLDALLSSLKTNELTPKESEKEKPVSQDNSVAKPAVIRVGAIKIVGNSRIDLATATISGSMKKRVRLKKLSVGELNNQKPNKLTPFKLSATINKHSKLSLNGKISPFSKKTNGEAIASLKAFELPEFSPLIRHELGYNINSGQLDAHINIKIRQNVLDGKTKIGIHKLIMEPADPDKMAKMTRQLAMPLDSALSLMRDGNDDIELDIPIKGDIAKPDFAIGDVINTAMGNALQGTVTSYLKYALQPYGLIYMAAEEAYGAATSVSLESVKFQPNERSLSDQSKQYMERIGQLMQERPGLRIRICGFATATDRVRIIELRKEAGKAVSKVKGTVQPDLFHDELLDLAREREHVVKSHLVSAYQISEDRLFTCLPKIKEEKGQLPRVELLI